MPANKPVKALLATLARCVILIAALCACVPAQGAEITVLSGNGVRAAIAELAAQFERASGHKVTLRFHVNPEAARAMIRFFTSPAAAPVLRATGIEPFVE